jgi:Ca2+-binding EF-hand superfamily protein
MEAKIMAVELSAEQKAELQRQKRAHRVNNELYFRAHPELRQMVSAFTSALLRDKPDDVHLYAEQFFTDPELAHNLGLVGWSRPETPEAPDALMVDGSGMVGGMEAFGGDEEEEEEFFEEEAEVGGTTEMNPVELENLLIDLFQEADADNSGTLDVEEFAKLMETANMGLSSAEVKLLLAEADENSDKTISYQEFVPLAVEVIQTMRLKARYDEFEEDVREELRDAASMIIGMSAEEVAGAVAEAADKVGQGGSLSKAQVKGLLKQPSFGLSKQQVSSAIAAVGFGSDGLIESAGLAANLYEILLAVVASALQMQSLGALGDEIVKVFTVYDKEDTGYLQPKVAKTALLQAFPFTTRVQINALISDPSAPYSEEGKLCWREYLPKITGCIQAMGDPAAIRERSELAARAEFQPVQMMSHVDREGFESSLRQLFNEADKDGNGVLDPHEFRRCLGEADLGLSHADMQDLMDHADADGDALISIDEFVQLAYGVLAQLSRERAIMKAMDAADSS